MTTRIGGRRERARQATLEEIRSTARTLLTTQGSAAVTINAVAREMGMSGPALYRYYASHDDLVTDLVVEFYRELGEATRTARDAHPERRVAHRLLAAARAMRAWAVEHPAEFGWIFASPKPFAQGQAGGASRHAAGADFERIFREEVELLWETAGFATPDLAELTPAHRRQLRAYSEEIGDRLPPEAAHVFLSSWVRLYGLLCMEVLNQLDFAYTDVEPVFEECLRDVCEMYGLTYTRPARRSR